MATLAKEIDCTLASRLDAPLVSSRTPAPSAILEKGRRKRQ
jgi:hypothetical protein